MPRGTEGCVKYPLLNFAVNQVLVSNAVGIIGWGDEWTHPASAERSQFKGSEAEDGLSSLHPRVFCKCLNLSTAQVLTQNQTQLQLKSWDPILSICCCWKFETEMHVEGE